MLLDWSDDYLTGIEKIDKQHKELHAKIHQLYEDILVCKEEKDFQEALDSLGKFAIAHFKAEEAFMRKHEYHGIKKHKKLHSEFLDEYSKLPKEYSEFDSNQVLAEQIADVVQKRIIDHIAQADMDYARYVKSQS